MTTHRNGPDFIGIGVQKAGTTWLYKWLNGNPLIGFPRPEDAPAIHMVDGKIANTWPKEVRFLLGENRDRGWDWYLRLFSRVGRVESFLGEITPDYLAADVDRIKELRLHVPDVKLVLILRDPVQRDWSAIRMWGERNEKLDDINALLKFAQSRHVISMGDYCSNIENWLRVFDRENLFIGVLEEIIDNPLVTIKAIVKHIGADSHYYDQPWVTKQLNEPVHVGAEKLIPEIVNELLVERHEKTIRCLNESFGIQLPSSWYSVANP